MADRVGSDHPSIRTVRGRLVRRGATRRPAVALSGEECELLPVEEIVRLVIDGVERHAPVAEHGDERILAGVYDNARRAREREGRDRLSGWVEAHAVEFGRSVLVDVVEPDEVYGLRLPGEDAVYEVDRGPADSLRRIAEDLES